MLRAVEDELLVNLVRDDDEIVFDGEVRDGAQMGGGDDCGGRIARRDEQDRLRARRDARCHFLRTKVEIVLLPRRHGHDDATGAANRGVIRTVARVGHEDFIAGIEEGLHDGV